MRHNTPLHLVIVTRTNQQMDGADRDCIALVNALDPEQFRVTWVGIGGCENLRPYLDARIVKRFVDIGLPTFPYLVRENAYQSRSPWLWTKIVADHCLRMLKPLWRLWRALRKERTDIVVTNTITVLIGAAYALLCRRPHVWLIKDCMPPDLKDCRAYARCVTRLSSAVVAPSTAVTKPFSEKVLVFADGTNVSAVLKGSKNASKAQILQSLGLPLDRVVVVQVGTMEETKGQLVTAAAVVKLSKLKPEPSFSLLFLGKGNEEYKRKVTAILAQAPIVWQEAIRFATFPPEDFSFLAAADIVVHPSMIPDTFPNAVREAMILGKPVIASRDGGLPEMIEDGKTGLLFTPGNVEELAQALDRLLAEQGMRERIGTAAQCFARSYFDVQVRKQPFCQLFHQLVLEARL